MPDNSTNNRRIAQNTILLYIRMLITLIISLYTSRVVLSVLGADDFGIYNVVGGVIVLFSFLTNAMTSSTQRFLNYNLGLNDKQQIAKVFNTAIITHLTILFIVLFLSETIGLWFVINKLNIPTERYDAMLWVYHMSVLMTLVNIMVIPYRSSIIAAEKMVIFAYVSIFETILKLIAVIVLPYISGDKLIVYAILLFVISIINFVMYKEACRKTLSFTKFHFYWDWTQYKDQMSFSGWYLFGGIATVGAKQGANILINIFFTVAVNAAVGIANQVRNAVYGFITSFQTAFNPQIVKLYAIQEHEKLLNLIYKSTKFSYYLLFILAFPVILFCEDILSIWLVNVPNYAVIFTQLVMISSFTEALSAPLWTAIGATGKVQKYQLYVSLIILLDIPLIYIAFTLGMNPPFAFGIILIIDIIAYVYRLLYIKKYISYNILSYIRNVIYPCFKITIISIPIPIILKYYSSTEMTTLLSIIGTLIISSAVIYFVGLDNNERDFMLNTLLRKFHR